MSFQEAVQTSTATQDLLPQEAIFKFTYNLPCLHFVYYYNDFLKAKVIFGGWGIMREINLDLGFILIAWIFVMRPQNIFSLGVSGKYDDEEWWTLLRTWQLVVSVGGLILMERGLNTTSAMSPELLEHHLGGDVVEQRFRLCLCLCQTSYSVAWLPPRWCLWATLQVRKCSNFEVIIRSFTENCVGKWGVCYSIGPLGLSLDGLDRALCIF